MGYNHGRGFSRYNKGRVGFGLDAVSDLETVHTDDPELDAFSPYQKLTSKVTSNLISLLMMKGYLDISHVKGKVINWGCGSGGECYIFRINGADVVGVDKFENAIDRLLEANILPADKAIVEDGNEYLKRLPDNTCDLITAFMFTPSPMDGGNSKWRSLLSDLYTESNRVIKPSGKILITSDLATMYDVKDHLFGLGEYIHSHIPEVPSAFIANKSNQIRLPINSNPSIEHYLKSGGRKSI